MPTSVAAAWCNDIVVLRSLALESKLEPNATVHGPLDFALTPLAVASDEQCIRLLLEHKADVRAQLNLPRWKTRFPVIHYAAARSDPVLLQALLKTDAVADVTWAAAHGETALHWLFVSEGPFRGCCFLDDVQALGLRKAAAERWKRCLALLLPLSPVRCYHDEGFWVVSYLMWVWGSMVNSMGRKQTIALLKQLLRKAKKDLSADEFDFLLDRELFCFDHFNPGGASDQDARLSTDARVIRKKLVRMLPSDPRSWRERAKQTIRSLFRRLR